MEGHSTPTREHVSRNFARPSFGSALLLSNNCSIDMWAMSRRAHSGAISVHRPDGGCPSPLLSSRSWSGARARLTNDEYYPCFTLRPCKVRRTFLPKVVSQGLPHSCLHLLPLLLETIKIHPSLLLVFVGLQHALELIHVIHEFRLGGVPFFILFPHLPQRRCKTRIGRLQYLFNVLEPGIFK